MRSVLGTLRQWFYPPEFRIAPPLWLPDLTAAIERPAPAPEEMPAPASQSERTGDAGDPRLLAEVCTALWRLRQKMVEPGTDRPLEEMRRAYRHFESAWDTLRQAGADVRDHAGEPYSDGSGLDVAAFEPRPGLQRETVVDTIKPTVVWKGRLIQVGQVVVGTPEQPGVKGDAGGAR